MSDSDGKALGGCVLVVLFGLLFGGCSVAKYASQTTVRATVSRVENVHHDSGSKYLVFTENEVFQCEDSLLFWKWNSSDQYGRLVPGHAYRFKVYGWRVPFLSWYRNIVTEEEVK